jgi:hypothetical protein
MATCANCAIGEWGFLAISANIENPGANQMIRATVGIPAIPLGIQYKVDYIKIDVEGMEPEVLLACKEVIDRDRPYLLIEQRECDGNEETVQLFLKCHGYKFEPIQGKYGEQYDLWCEPVLQDV